MSKFFYLLKSGLKNLIHHRKIGIVLIITMVIIISLNLFLLLFYNNMKTAIKNLNKNIRIEVIFSKEVTTEEVNEVINFARKNKDVDIKEIIYNDAKENLKNFIESSETIKKIYPLIDENPLPPTLLIKVSSNYRTLKNIELFVRDLKNFKTEEILYPRDWFSNIFKISQWVELGTIGLIVIFLIVSYILWMNIFKVALFSVQKEIEIMEIVGGTKLYIRTPFLIETFIYTVISFLISYGIVNYVFVGISKVLDNLVFLNQDQIIFPLLISVLITVSGTERAITGFIKK
ncbi:MAG TPA: permease-like cell division protein FtsX [Candidatus Mcinerneyibacterium sp.]|nr:permease-like cell division protein FtsX [Candidatus Mcinerneyibacterium sp.]